MNTMYDDMKAKFETARNKEAGKPINSNTRLFMEDDVIVLVLFGHKIIYYYPDGSIRLDSCGWQTNTTKERFNEFTPFSIRQAKRVWYISANDNSENRFKDGMLLTPTVIDGNNRWLIDGTMSDDEVKEINQLQSKIDNYINKFFKNVPVPEPSGGDCWYCVMVTEDGHTMGDHTDNDHLLEHIKEDYFVPSLLLNAIREAGWTDFVIYMSGLFKGTTSSNARMDWRVTLAKRALKNYMYARLIHNRKVAC